METPDTIRDKIGKLINERGITLQDLSLQVGMNKTYFYQYLKRKTPKRLDEHVRRNLAYLLDIDEQELSDLPIKRMNLNISSDTISSLEELNFQSRLTNDISLFKINDLGLKKRNLDPNQIELISAPDDDMAEIIKKRDLLCVDTSIKSATSNGIYVFKFNDNVIIRNVIIDPFNKSVVVSSENKSLPPMNVKDTISIETYGRVIGFARNLIS